MEELTEKVIGSTAVEGALSQTASTPATDGNGPAPVIGLAADLAAKHGAEGQPGVAADKPKDKPERRGRPATHGLYSKAAGSNGKNPVKPIGQGALAQTEAQPLPPVRRSIPPGLLARVTKQALSTAENFALLKLATVAAKAGLDKEDIEPQIKQAALGEENKAILADLAPHICDEWGIDPELSPSVMAGIILVPYVGSFGMALFTLSKLATEKALKDKKP